MKDDLFPPGSVSPDDPAVQQVMEIIDKLRPSEQRALMCNTYRAVLAFKRTGDIDHLVNFAKNLITTIRLRSIPEYVEALESAPSGRSEGDSLDVDEVIKDLTR